MAAFRKSEELPCRRIRFTDMPVLNASGIDGVFRKIKRQHIRFIRLNGPRAVGNGKPPNVPG